MTNTHSGFDLLRNVDVCLSVELGRTTMKLKQVMALSEGSVVALDRLTDELLDVMVNGRVIAKAEIVNQDGRFALRIAEMGAGDDDDGNSSGVGGAGHDTEPAALPAGLEA